MSQLDVYAATNKLFDRYYRATIGGSGGIPAIQLEGLDVEFKVRKSLRPRHPNTAHLKIYNLSPVSRSQIQMFTKIAASPAQQTVPVPLRLEAGYKKNFSQIYFGEVRYCQSTQDGVDVITELSSGDSEKKIQAAQINTSFAPGTPPGTILVAVVKALGVSRGNTPDAITLMKNLGITTMFGSGCVLSGNAARAMDNFCKSAGLEWSVQDGKLQFLQKGQALPAAEEQAVVLSSNTGLLGSPTVDTLGVATAVCLMIPYLTPGRKVQFDGKDLKGDYRIAECKWHGETKGKTWQCKILATKVVPVAA